MEKSTHTVDFCLISQMFFSTGDQSYDNKSSNFQFIEVATVHVQILMLGPCVIGKLQSFGYSRLNIIMYIELVFTMCKF